MAMRTFCDSLGRTWEVWSISPAQFERRADSVVSSPGVEPNTRPPWRVSVGAEWNAGWLAFETSGDKRRLTPYPPNWAEWSEAELERLCERAIPVDARRRLLG